MISANEVYHWQCRGCERQFETRGKRDAHTRKEHQKVTTNINGMRGNDGTMRRDGEKFRCKCGKEFLHPSSLQRHSKRCNHFMFTIDNEDENMVENNTNQDEGILGA